MEFDETTGKVKGSREEVQKLYNEVKKEYQLEAARSALKEVWQDEYDAKKQERLNRLADILEQMAMQPQAKPAQVRNYAMACKPQGVRLAWECNFKHALHSSPCGCAKPQMGGKWIILGKNTKKEIKDDI